MSADNKYEIELTSSGDVWTAKLMRKISRKKRVTTLEESGFADKALAQDWADKALGELIASQEQKNKTQAAKRKESAEVKRNRSARRAEKTKLEKSSSEEL